MQSRLALFGGKPVRRKPFHSNPLLGRAERNQVLGVLKSGLLSGFVANASDAFYGGPQVRELEKSFGRYFGIRFAVAMNSATSALHAALLAVGVEPGDEVLVSPYTMCASASSIVMCGGIPVFVDIESDTYGMDPSKIEQKITPRTRAIVLVHLFGQAAQIAPILKIAKKHGLKIIEDCAQSPGATYQHQLTGTFGDIAVFSFNQHKTITAGEGGVAITRRPKLALKMQLVRNHGEAIVAQMKSAKNIACLGWNYRITELDASVAVAQFRKLDYLNKRRIALAGYLTRKLEGLPGLRLSKPKKNCRHVYFAYPIGYNAGGSGISRDLLVKALSAEGIPFSPGYVRPLYWEPMYQARRIFERSQFPFNLQKKPTPYHRGLCPVAERCYLEGLLSTDLCRYPLTKRDIDDVVRAFHKIFRARSILAKKGSINGAHSQSER